MKALLSPLLIASFLVSGCTSDSYRETAVDNPDFRENTAFESFEDLTSPKFGQLRARYQLDTLFHGEEDEFRRILLLRDWIRDVIEISDFEDSYPGGGYAEGILDAALEGQGFHCGHYMIVQNAVMNAYGYVTRCLGAGPSVAVDDREVLFSHHGVNEIWSNTHQKWFLSDAKYNHHFEKDGIPMSALEIRDEYLKNQAVDVVLVKGPDRTPIDFDWIVNRRGDTIKTEASNFAQMYTWISWESTNNRFTEWPDNGDQISRLVFYADDYFKDNTWIRDGEPHWAYGTEFMTLVYDRGAIEWTPNTVEARALVEGDLATIELTSSTPNLKSYQMKDGAKGEWKDVSASVEIELEAQREEVLFRAVNIAGVAGPEHTLVLEK